MPAGNTLRGVCLYLLVHVCSLDFVCPETGQLAQQCKCERTAVNVAQGKYSWSDGHQHNHPPAHATDGNDQTFWATPHDNQDGHWWQIDLGTHYSICAFTITWEYSFAVGFTIDGSQDGATWIPLVKVTRGGWPGNQTHYIMEPDNTPVRLLKVIVNKRRAGFAYTAFYEFFAFGQLSEPVNCQPGWTRFRRECVQLVLESSVYAGTAARCGQLKTGAQLFKIEDQQANEFAASLSRGLTPLLGATDAETEGIWKWDTGEKLTYFNWGKYEPNDAAGKKKRPPHVNLEEWPKIAGKDHIGEDCVRLNSDGFWNDVACSHSSTFLCAYRVGSWEEEDKGNCHRQCPDKPWHYGPPSCANKCVSCNGHGACNCKLVPSKISAFVYPCVCDSGYDPGSNCLNCTDGLWGPSCANKCPQCAPTALCNQHTGECYCPGNFDSNKDCEDCSPGFWGPECEHTCPNCNHGSCSQGVFGTGQCECHLGFSDKKHCKDCEEGWYGPDCKHKCTTCNGHGKCVSSMASRGCACHRHWDVNKECAECIPDHYGGNCRKKCPSCHSNGRCTWGHKGSGKCTCFGNYDPNTNCAECLNLFFGPQCDIQDEYTGRYESALYSMKKLQFHRAVQYLDKCVALGNDTLKSLVLRAKVQLLKCNLEEAKKDFHEIILRSKKTIRCSSPTVDTHTGEAKCGTVLNEDVDSIQLNKAQSELQLIYQLEHNQTQAILALGNKQWGIAVNILSSVLAVCKMGVSMHMMRAKAALEINEFAIVKYDAVSVINQDKHNSLAIFYLARATYQIGAIQQSLGNLKYCLSMDPDSVDCLKFYQRVAALQTAMNAGTRFLHNKEWQQAAKSFEEAFELEIESGPNAAELKWKLCDTHGTLRDVHQAHHVFKWCQDALETYTILGETRNVRQTLAGIHFKLARAYMMDRLFTPASYHINSAKSLDNGSLRGTIDNLINQINKNKEQAERKDYYAILGIEKTATDKEVKKAYRRLAFQWHPDKFQAPEEKEVASQMFAEVLEAYEVLSDQDLRHKYDHGVNIQEEMKRRQRAEAQRAAREDPPPRKETKINVDKKTYAKGEAEVEYENDKGEKVKVRVSFDGKKLMPEHCCIEWTGEW